MGFKITKTTGDPFEAKGPFLCCTLNKGAECDFCHERMCTECAKAWSPRKHFILDMCRKRFSKEQLDAAAKCYAERLSKSTHGEIVGTGKCDVCIERKSSRHNDRHFDKLEGEEDYADWNWLDP